MSAFALGVLVGIVGTVVSQVLLGVLLWWMGRPDWHPGCYTRDTYKER